MKPTRKQLISWSILAALVVGLTLTAWALINNALYSPASFVSQYLSAISRHDAASALSMPGVGDAIDDEAEDVLLRSDALGDLQSISIGKVSGTDSAMTVTAKFTIEGKAANTSFTLKRIGNVMGIFEGWAFATPPVATANIAVAHSSLFDVGNLGPIDMRGTNPDTSSDFAGTGKFSVFAPSSYSFGLTTDLVAAKTQLTAAIEPGSTLDVAIDAQATKAFNEKIQKQMDEYLDECVTQTVLQPTGCPFGYQTGNRIVGEPTWSVVSYPEIVIVPGETQWVVRDAVAVVNITGEVQSLYDGTISPLNENVDAVFNLNIELRPDGGVSITLV